LSYINNTLIFQPTKCNDHKNIELFNKNYSDVQIQFGYINLEIHYVLLKSNTNANTLYLFSHGNAGNLINRYNSNNIKMLLNTGSVLLYDYRGYGLNNGTPSEANLREDIMAVWNYIPTLGYKHSETILYGESLGCSISSWFCANLAQDDWPKGLILQSGFYSISKLVSELAHPLLCYLLTVDFNNAKYIEEIKNKKNDFPIIILHSKTDGLINYNHARNLSDEFGCKLLEIKGDHNNPIFTSECVDYISSNIKK